MVLATCARTSTVVCADGKLYAPDTANALGIHRQWVSTRGALLRQQADALHRGGVAEKVLSLPRERGAGSGSRRGQQHREGRQQLGRFAGTAKSSPEEAHHLARMDDQQR